MNKFEFNADSADNCIGVSKEYRRLYYKNTVPDGRVLVFLTGFCLGMVFFYLSGVKLIGEECLPAALSMENISRLHDFDFNSAGLLEYVADIRIGQLILLLICASGIAKRFFAYIILGWGGFEIGIVMFTLLYQYGLKGFLFSIMLLFPHWIIFFIVFCIIFFNGIESNVITYHNPCTITWGDIHNRISKLKRIFLIIFLWCIGILSEVYINTEIIKKAAIFFK